MSHVARLCQVEEACSDWMKVLQWQVCCSELARRCFKGEANACCASEAVFSPLLRALECCCLCLSMFCGFLFDLRSTVNSICYVDTWSRRLMCLANGGTL
ncbi:MAG: hypothetical protein ACKESB_02790 [Candidatus Hodgkinia cicadicola]